MKILNEVLAQAEASPDTGSGKVLIAALASACSSRYGVSLIDASVKLDENGKRLFGRLARIAEEPDYSNSAQDRVLDRLRVLGFIH